jgi:hypothetical protein
LCVWDWRFCFQLRLQWVSDEMEIRTSQSYVDFHFSNSLGNDLSFIYLVYERPSQPRVCCRVLCGMARICCGHYQRATFGRNHFVLPICMRPRLLCFPNDHGCCRCRSIQDDSARCLFHLDGTRSPGRSISLVYEGFVCIHWTIYCGLETSAGRLSGFVLLHLLGLDDSTILIILYGVLRTKYQKSRQSSHYYLNQHMRTYVRMLQGRPLRTRSTTSRARCTIGN